MLNAYTQCTQYGGWDLFGYDMNQTLRDYSWDQICPNKQQVITDFDKLFVDGFDQETVLYRVASENTLKIQDGTFYCPAFMSTSRCLSSACIFLNRILETETAVLLKIIWPAEEPVVDVGSGVNNEQEVILPRNRRFCVKSWSPNELEQLKINSANRPVSTFKLVGVSLLSDKN